MPRDSSSTLRKFFIGKEGDEVILSPRPLDSSGYLSDGPVLPAWRASRLDAVEALGVD